jgi:5'-3' exonuclease
MGIPAFLRLIMMDYPDTHYWDDKVVVNHLYIDANSILYNIYYSYDKNHSMADFEQYLINEFIKFIQMLIKTTNVDKSVYIALDGSAPRAKMVQQRSRRYKSVYGEEILKQIENKYGVNEDKFKWNTQKITPGTEFMYKLSENMKKYIKSGKLSNKDIKIIFSDSNVPGEGEHKIMPNIRSMKNTNDIIGIFSPDADMIVLAMTVDKNNILIIRTPPDNKDIEAKYGYISSGKKFIYLSIDKYRDAFVKKIKDEIGINTKFKSIDIINDYIFLTFLSGNDFVNGISYLKVKEESPGKSGGLKITLDIYKKILMEKGNHLITFENEIPKINMEFLKNIFLELSKNEDYFMRKIKQTMEGIRDGKLNNKVDEKEEALSPHLKEWVRFQHREVFNPLHPEYNKYKNIVSAIDTNQPKHIWKEQYYTYFFGISSKNIGEYNRVRSEICQNYLESLVFTLYYYYDRVPSWTFYYRYRMPPIASDIYTNLDKYITDINKIQFNLGVPYTPLIQLMMTLPPQMKDLLPKKYGDLMQKGLMPFYPIGFELEYLSGSKYIYSEPILPLLYDDIITKAVDGIKLTKKEIERNTLVNEPFIYE